MAASGGKVEPTYAPAPHVWDLGSGGKLADGAIPYAYGTDDYYNYIADKRRAAAGDTGPAKGARLTQLEQGLAADKLALPAWQKESGWQDAHNANMGEYATALADYNAKVAAWKQGGNDFVKGMDHSGQAAAGYAFVPSGQQTGQAWSSDGGLGAAAEGTYQGLTGSWKSTDPAATGLGKYGGAGNENPATSVDNSWNANDGIDVRTDEQKYYDRTMGRWEETPDAEGHYSWYGTETGYDPKDPNASRRINASELATRTTAPQDVDSGKGAVDGIDRTKFWDYNQGANNSGLVQPHSYDKAFFDNDVRNRKDVSIYGRTA